MPIFEYECPECLVTHELFKKFVNVDEPAPCPTCGTVMTKKISSASFVLKGSGWEKDGYR